MPVLNQKLDTICPLDEILKYDHKELVSKLTTQFAITLEESADLFTETKKWLWLCAYEIDQINHAKQKNQVVRIPFASSVVILDEVWHLFLQNTRDYQNFCMMHFGFFVHHEPAGLADIESYVDKYNNAPKELEESYHQELRSLMSYVYDHLGAETVRKWFSEYSDRYSVEKLKKIHIHLK